MANNEGAGWLSRHKWLTAFIVVLVIGWASNAGAGEAEPADARERSSARQVPAPQHDTPSDDAAPEPSEDPVTGDADASSGRRDETGGSGGHGGPRAKPSPRPEPPAQTYLVTRVIDGDTLELASGQDVRLVGIDTPEAGECGYDKATANLTHLVEGQQVRLTRSDEDRDRYGRLLRYVNVGDVDAGLRLVKNGLAIARYDSRDGYGYHQREPVYIAADRSHSNITCPKPQPLVSHAAPGNSCAPGYTPCVPPYPPDVDCADVNGPIHVTGSDPHGLDADGDGVACE